MKLVISICLFVGFAFPAWAEPPEEHNQVHNDPYITVEAPAHAAPKAPKKFKPHSHVVNARARQNLGRMEGAPPKGAGRQITVQSTAYCLRGFTARGTQVRYGTVAVDPRIIPLGSKIYIPGYGWGQALDTGGAIRGNIIDIWLPSLGQCYQWGNRSVTITVFDR